MAEALAEVEGRGQTLPGELAFAEAQVGDAAEVQAIGLSPGVLAIRVFGPVERAAGVPEGLFCVAGRGPGTEGAIARE